MPPLIRRSLGMHDRLKGFRTLAEQAARKAKATADKDTKTRLRNLADGWNHLADLLEADIERLARNKGNDDNIH
jgi:hypothetical protein